MAPWLAYRRLMMSFETNRPAWKGDVVCILDMHTGRGYVPQVSIYASGFPMSLIRMLQKDSSPHTIVLENEAISHLQIGNGQKCPYSVAYDFDAFCRRDFVKSWTFLDPEFREANMITLDHHQLASPHPPTPPLPPAVGSHPPTEIEEEDAEAPAKKARMEEPMPQERLRDAVHEQIDRHLANLNFEEIVQARVREYFAQGDAATRITKAVIDALFEEVSKRML